MSAHKDEWISEDTKQHGIWGAVIAAVVAAIVILGMRGCSYQERVDGQKDAIRMECIKVGRTPADCNTIQ